MGTWELPELSALGEHDLDQVLERYRLEERDLSQRRDEVHATIDAVYDVRVERLRLRCLRGEELADPDAVAAAIARVDANRRKRRRTRPLPAAPVHGLVSLDDLDLRRLLDDLEREDDRVSRRRRELHWLIDAVQSWRRLVDGAAAP